MADPLSLASAIAGLASLAIEVSRISFEYASEVRHASKAVSEYLRELSALTSAVLRLQGALSSREVQDALEDSASQAANPSILQCLDDMETLRIRLDKYAASGVRRKFQTLLWPFEEKETRKSAEMLHRHCSALDLLLSADTLVVSSKALSEIRSLKIDDRRQKILDWLSTCPFRQKQAEVFRSHCEGTSQWLLHTDQYIRWRKGEHNVLWCHGNRMSLCTSA